ncbi:MAG: hypothetical protein R3300_07290 [Candidatus Promineifilaceae bacterium]|nr:hypothetical protein [Candidatus Promineifilaceae bacterium]
MIRQRSFNHSPLRLALAGAALVFLLLVIVLVTVSVLEPGAGQVGAATVYEETFDTAGSWGEGETHEVTGQVANGVYELEVRTGYGLFTATAGQTFGDGVYELEATQLDGPLNNGYGMVFRVDEAGDAFYAFEVSGDGWVWIGYCQDRCRGQAIALVGQDWFRSPTVNVGLGETNKLRVVAEGSLMSFYVNGIEVGRAADGRLTSGDIGVMVETLGQRGVRVAFDNYRVNGP